MDYAIVTDVAGNRINNNSSTMPRMLSLNVSPRAAQRSGLKTKGIVVFQVFLSFSYTHCGSTHSRIKVGACFNKDLINIRSMFYAI